MSDLRAAVEALAEKWSCPTCQGQTCVYCNGASFSRATVSERLRAILAADAAPTPSGDEGVFVGSLALIGALYETYVEHIGIPEPDGPDGPYMWCACGWRSDDLGSDNPGQSYAVHLTNAQHAAAVKALQPIVRRITPAPAAAEPTGGMGLTAEEWRRLWVAAGNGIGRLGRADVEFERILADRLATARAEAWELLGGKVIRLAQVNAVLARANGRAEERRWLDLIHALEALMTAADRARGVDGGAS